MSIKDFLILTLDLLKRRILMEWQISGASHPLKTQGNKNP